jgi:RNA polymerase sigma-70 factor (ECF subfamily)
MTESPLDKWDDAPLVQAALEGRDEAFAVLIDRYRPAIFGTAWSALQDFDDAEDATQETFVLAYRHLKDLKDPARFAPWACSIASNVARKWLGKRALNRRRFVRLEAVSEEDVKRPESPPGQPTSPEELKKAFETLSPEDRSVTTLFYLVGLDQQQIAGILGIPAGTVKSRLHRSRKKLKRRLLDMAKQSFEHRVTREDYGRAVIGGMRGVIHWQGLLEQEGLSGWRQGRKAENNWTRSGEAIIGEDVDGHGERLFTGDASWMDYELSLLITPLSGGNAQVQFRLSEDGQRYYMLDLLLGWQAVAISKVDRSPGSDGLQKLSVVNFPVEIGREYDVLIAAREASLTSYIDGKLVNQVTDSSYRSGPIALNVWQSKTAYRDPRIRFLH